MAQTVGGEFQMILLNYLHFKDRINLPKYIQQINQILRSYREQKAKQNILVKK
jgi:hypothetical protein